MSDAPLRANSPLKSSNDEFSDITKNKPNNDAYLHIGDSNNYSGMSQTNTQNEWETSDSKVAVYLRVSTDDQSVDAQFLAIEGLLRQYNLDVNDVRLFKDEGISATKKTHLQDRPAGSAMIDLIDAGKIKKVFSYAIGRMFRDNEAGAVFLKMLKNKYPDVAIITYDCPIPFNTPMGEFLFTMMVGLARLEVAQLGERTLTGMDSTREQLKVTSHAVFGWDIILDEDGIKRMVPNWKQQDVFDWVINQKKTDSYAKIARQLNEWGILTVTGRPFIVGTIRSMVNEPPKQQEMLHVFDRPDRRSKPPFRTLSVTQK